MAPAVAAVPPSATPRKTIVQIDPEMPAVLDGRRQGDANHNGTVGLGDFE
jgi:hypothetical protein